MAADRYLRFDVRRPPGGRARRRRRGRAGTPAAPAQRLAALNG